MITVLPARPGYRATALSLLFGGLPEDERQTQTSELLEAARRGEICLDGLLLAEADGEPAGAALYIVQRDRTAFVWPPVVSDHPAVDGISDALMQELVRRIDAASAWFGQAIVEPDERHDRDVLTRNGFASILDLIYLQRPLNEPLPDRAEAGLETVAYDPRTNRGRFAEVIEQTYIGSLDCPELKGFRTGEEALAGHEAAGEFHPSRWKIYRAGSRDVGVLLLTDQPEQRAWEVVYMGIIPEARGRGTGRAMLLCGLHEAREAGRDSVLLAVDSRNDPAIKLYRELGFRDVAVRAVHGRVGIGGLRIEGLKD